MTAVIDTRAKRERGTAAGSLATMMPRITQDLASRLNPTMAPAGARLLRGPHPRALRSQVYYMGNSIFAAGMGADNELELTELLELVTRLWHLPRLYVAGAIGACCTF